VALCQELPVAELLDVPTRPCRVATTNETPGSAAAVARTTDHWATSSGAAMKPLLTRRLQHGCASLITGKEGFKIEAIVVLPRAAERQTSALMTTAASVAWAGLVALTIVQATLALTVWRTAKLARLASSKLTTCVEAKLVIGAGPRLDPQAPHTNTCCMGVDALMTTANDAHTAAILAANLAYRAAAR
jgi:hypothetical protein